MRKQIATLRRIAGELKELRKELERGMHDDAERHSWPHKVTVIRDHAMILADEIEAKETARGKA